MWHWRDCELNHRFISDGRVTYINNDRIVYKRRKWIINAFLALEENIESIRNMILRRAF